MFIKYFAINMLVFTDKTVAKKEKKDLKWYLK